MEIIRGVHITKSKTGDIWSNIIGTYVKFDDEDAKNALMKLYRIGKKRSVSEDLKLDFVIKTRDYLAHKYNVDIISTELDEEQRKVRLTIALNKLISFFSEFNFEPNFRFVNTLSLTCRRNKDEAKDYIKNYFALTDNGYINGIIEKMKSSEFEDILADLTLSSPNAIINKRFKLYYGSQGTGKTTQAMKEADNNVMLCHSALLPSDLMEDFKFSDGKAQFNPSNLCKAMTEGKTIVLDEINLLPFESLRFLQSLLDGKSQFTYKDQTINIKEGFMIIGTMNLQVNGMTYAIPEPLVDRASELKQYKLTADNLLSAVM